MNVNASLSKVFMKISLLGFVALGGCATTYVPPSKPAPLAWQADSNFKDLKAEKVVINGIKSVGDVIYQDKIIPTKVAEITEDVVYTSPFGSKVTIPKGTLAIAEQYSLIQSSRYSGGKNLNADNDPIEWCFSNADKKGATCAFWEGDETARYISVHRISERIYLPIMSAGMVGPMLKFRELSEDPRGPIIFSAKIMALDENEITIETFYLDNGDESSILRAKKYKWNSNGEFKNDYYHLRLVKADGKLSVEVLE